MTDDKEKPSLPSDPESTEPVPSTRPSGAPQSVAPRRSRVAELKQIALRKLDLSRKYYSGELEALRKTMRVVAASLPWRVLRYERVLDPETAVLPLARNAFVTPKTFRKHLQLLKRDCNVIPLDELVELLLTGKGIQEKTVAITIDGGWNDAFTNAFPVIREVDLPVSFFLPTAFVGSNDLLWTDKVALALLEMKRAGMTIEPFEYFDEEMKQRFYAVCPEGEITFPAIFAMIDGIRRASPEHRLVTLGFLGAIVNKLGGEMPHDSFFVNWEEVQTMARSGGVRFGSLGHQHFSFRGIPEDVIADDLRVSKGILRDYLDAPLSILASPHGDFDGKMITAMEALDFKACLAEDALADEYSYAKPIPLIRRISINQLVAATAETFFCRIWDIPVAADAVES